MGLTPQVGTDSGKPGLEEETGVARFAVAVDIGGTFVDLAAVDVDTGRTILAKVPLIHIRHADAVLEALGESGVAPEAVVDFRYCSNVAMLSLKQRKGPATALITTKGFRDVLELGRGDRPDVFNFLWDPEPPLVRRRNRVGVDERVDFKGKVICPLNEEELRRAARFLASRGIEAVAVCFIGSYMNPVHELRAKEIIREGLPEAFVCCSSDLAPEIQEFERMSTTVVNAYLGPIMKRYFAELTSRVHEWGFSGDMGIAHSGGGMMSIRKASLEPAYTCVSGPAAGVIGAAHQAKASGFDNLITLEMGGTTATVGFVRGGQPLRRPRISLEFRMPLNLPCVDATPIGFGGASIAWIDKGGTLKCGPYSAGTFPGPACYGLGGADATLTDANLVLGRISPETMLGGKIRLSPELARECIRGNVADFYGMTVEEAAEGVISVANLNVRNEIGFIAVERGYDPKDFVLVACGGMGPLHGADIARELGIRKVLIPKWPGFMSALGLLQLDIQHSFVSPILKRVDELDPEDLNRCFGKLEDRAISSMTASEQVSPDDVQFLYSADLRYCQQSDYLSISLLRKKFCHEDLFQLTKDFTERHQSEFGYSLPAELAAVEVVNVRVCAIVPRPKYECAAYSPSMVQHDEKCEGRRVYFGKAGGFLHADVYDRASLVAGATFQGPAVVEQYDSTTLVPPGVTASVDEYLNLILEV